MDPKLIWALQEDTGDKSNAWSHATMLDCPEERRKWEAKTSPYDAKANRWFKPKQTVKLVM